MDFATSAFLFWLCLLLPALAFLGWWRMRTGKPLHSKLWRFRVAAVGLTTEGVLALLAARSKDIDLPILTSPFLVLSGVALGLFMALSVRRRWSAINAEHRARQIKLFAADNPAELRWGVVLGICAGLFEEIAYRGVLFSLLQRVIPLAGAIAVCAIIFALAHVTQGIRGFTGVLIIGLLFHVFLFATGTLGMGIAMHIVYDVALFTIMYRFNVKERAATAATS